MNDLNKWEKHEENGHPQSYIQDGVYAGTVIFKGTIFSITTLKTHTLYLVISLLTICSTSILKNIQIYVYVNVCCSNIYNKTKNSLMSILRKMIKSNYSKVIL